MTNYQQGDSKVTLMFLRKRIRPGTSDDCFVFELLKYVKVQHNTEAAGEPSTYFQPITGLAYTSSSANNTGGDLTWLPDVSGFEVLDQEPAFEVTSVR